MKKLHTCFCSAFKITLKRYLEVYCIKKYIYFKL